MTPDRLDRDDWPSLGDAELDVLKLLWERGPATVRELYEAFEASGASWAYTTVQTMLGRLEEKGYVLVDRSRIAHVFSAAVSRETMLGARASELVDKLCDGAVAPLVLSLVRDHRFTRDDLAHFRRLLDDAQREDAARREDGA